MASTSLIVRAASTPTAKRAVSLLAKTAGLAGAAAIIYDSHKCGQADGKMKEYTDGTDVLIKQYNDSKISNSRSTIAHKLQKDFFNIQLNSGVNGFMAHTAGYVSGFGGNILNNIIPLGLSAGALFLKKGSKLCAVGLGICGLKTLFYDVMGIGRSPKQKV